MSASKPNTTVAYEKQADALLAVRPSDYKIGSFIWGIEDMWTEEYRDFTCYIWDLITGIPPIKRLCKEDCKGLCTHCGVNLNEETCGCQADADDESADCPEENPWLALDALNTKED